VSLLSAFSRRLYLRIWLAMATGVVLLATVAGWAWHIAAEHNAPHSPPREVIVRNEKGVQIGSAIDQVQRQPGAGLEFQVTLNNGQTLVLQLPPRDHRGPPREPPPYWTRPPYGFLWLLMPMGLVVAVGVYPVVRRLTQRLEALQGSVQRWGEGDLSVRVPEYGYDEVADLSVHFNAAASRIESLMATQHQLLAAQKSLLANASHELRSPLTRIRMSLELMSAQSSPNSRAEITRNISELDQLIDEILLASRLDAHEADLGSIELIDLLGLAAEESARIDAELELNTDIAHLQVQGVAKLLRRLVRNLLENARRYGNQAEGHAVDPNAAPDIVLSLSHETKGKTDFAVLRVLDRGPGVPPELRERIFEPFYRLPGASERHGGVGLGLALVKSIAERHDGNVHCEDREGGGACFVVKLPVGKATG